MIKTVKNPVTGEWMTKKGVKKVRALREARLNARKAARSGHPGRRADGKKALEMIPMEIRKVYLTDGSPLQ